MQIISAGSSLIFLQADLSKTSNNRLPILSKMEIILLNSLADPKSGIIGKLKKPHLRLFLHALKHDGIRFC